LIIQIVTPTGINQYTVGVLNQFKTTVTRGIEYVRSLNMKTQAWDHGANFDKYYTDITIQGTKSDMEAISEDLNKDIGQITIDCADGEYIFGAGIDYSYNILCNVMNSKREFSQNDIALSTIKLSLQGISSNIVSSIYIPLGYRSEIPYTADTFPHGANIQTPVDRQIVKRESEFTALAYGDYGKNIEVDDNGVPVSAYDISVVLDQTFAKASEIEKFCATQRTEPFVFTQLNFLYLFPDQDTKKVMIRDLISTRVGHNNWRLTLKLSTNV
jgi:hypothetical protein